MIHRKEDEGAEASGVPTTPEAFKPEPEKSRQKLPAASAGLVGQRKTARGRHIHPLVSLLVQSVDGGAASVLH